MDRALYEKVTRFRESMSIAKEMLKKEIISAEDYSKICTVMAQEYGLNSWTIFAENSLRTTETEAKVQQKQEKVLPCND